MEYFMKVLTLEDNPDPRKKLEKIKSGTLKPEAGSRKREAGGLKLEA